MAVAIRAHDVRTVNPAALLVTYLLAVRPSRCGSPPSHTMGMAVEDSIMSKNPDTNSADRDAEIEREIQTNRKFSLSEARANGRWRLHERRIAGHPQAPGRTRNRQVPASPPGRLGRCAEKRVISPTRRKSAQWRLRSATRSPCGVHPKNSYVGGPPGGVRPRSRRGVGTSAKRAAILSKAKSATSP